MKTLNKLTLIFILFISITQVSTVNGQCSASFTYSDLGGLVFFTSTSNGGTNYYWDFGDGNTDTYIDSPFTNYVDPSNSYNTNGSYTVCLAIQDSATGCTDTVCQVITIISASPCSLVTGFTSVDNGGGNYSFTSSIVGGTNPFTYAWWFSPGNTSSAVNSNFTYPTFGTYYPTLTVTDTSGCSSSYTDTISFINPCNYSISSTPINSNGTDIQFSTNGSGTSYFWDFNDGNTSTQSNPANLFSVAGAYNVCLTIDSCTPVCDSIVINNVCNYTVSKISVGSSTNTFSFSSSGPNGTFTYNWDFGDGTFSNQQFPQHTYASSGTYYYCLIKDSCAPVCDSVTVSVCNISANFTYVDNGNGNYTFTNTSTGNYTSSSWYFSDGGSSSTANPSHTFLYNTSYTIRLQVFDSINNCSDWALDTILVTGSSPCPTNASFTYVNNGNGNISFTNTSTVGTYSLWDFGDISFNNSWVSNPTHTYLSNGTYIVCLRDSFNSCIDIFCDTITINNVSGCNVVANFTTTNNQNGSIVFASNSTGNFTTEIYNYGDGTTGTSNNHTYTTNGTYTVCLTASDSSQNCSDTFCGTVIISNINCSVVAGFTYVNNGNGNVTFTSNSTGIFISEVYNYGDGATGALNNHTYTASGIYVVCLTTTDFVQGCSNTFCDSVIVNNVGAPCSITANYSFVNNGNGNYSFTNTSTGNIAAYYWNFGDGTSSNAISPNHTFISNGVFVVELVAIDSSGSCIDYHLVTIQVTGVQNPTSCNAAFVIFPDSASNSNVIVFNTATGNNLNYFWDFGDGNTSTLQNPFYTYTANGPFYLCLTVSDGNGCSSTYCDSISSGGVVLKQIGFTINVETPIATGIEEDVNLISDINMYPNPVKNVLTINLNVNEQTQVEVFVTDLLGKTIQSIANQNLNVGNNKLQWETNNVSNGIYLLNIKTNNSLQVKKIVVNR